MKEVEVKVANNEKCSSFLHLITGNGSAEEFDAENLICAGEKSTFNEKSVGFYGAPLMYKSGDQHILIGVRGHSDIQKRCVKTKSRKSKSIEDEFYEDEFNYDNYDSMNLTDDEHYHEENYTLPNCPEDHIEYEFFNRIGELTINWIIENVWNPFHCGLPLYCDSGLEGDL